MVSTYSLGRESILRALRETLQPLPYIHAMWEGGAAAFDRIDQWSDIDLIIDVEDGYVDQTIDIVKTTLAAISPIDLEYRLPEPTWHGHSQVFYRLTASGPYLLLDTVFIQHSSEDKFLEPGQHGNLVVHFDKSGVVKQIPRDKKIREELIASRLEAIPLLFDLFQILIHKEIHRKNWIEAIAFYNAYILRPLVELLRIHHKPERYNFSTRYIYYDLPSDVIRGLEDLYFVGDPSELHVKQNQAEA